MLFRSRTYGNHRGGKAKQTGQNDSAGPVSYTHLRHRIGLTYEAEAMNMSSDEIVSKILNKVDVP